jgi:hypothetical protein
MRKSHPLPWRTSKLKFRNAQSSVTHASQALPWRETDAMDGIKMVDSAGNAFPAQGTKNAGA